MSMAVADIPLAVSDNKCTLISHVMSTPPFSPYVSVYIRLNVVDLESGVITTFDWHLPSYPTHFRNGGCLRMFVPPSWCLTHQTVSLIDGSLLPSIVTEYSQGERRYPPLSSLLTFVLSIAKRECIITIVLGIDDPTVAQCDACSETIRWLLRFLLAHHITSFLSSLFEKIPKRSCAERNLLLYWSCFVKYRRLSRMLSTHCRRIWSIRRFLCPHLIAGHYTQASRETSVFVSLLRAEYVIICTFCWQWHIW